MSRGSYDSIAEWYDAFVQEQPIYSDVVLPNLLALAGDVQGRRVCDIACGQGLATRELARHGARVTGVDVSERILALARQYEAGDQLGIDYVLDDAQVLSTQADASFDGVTCSMGLINIPDLNACIQSVRRILKPGGWFVFCITHPCFESPHAEWIDRDGRISRLLHGYFEEGYWRAEDPERLRGMVGDWHRMISTYVNTLINTDFALERMLEPRITGEMVRQRPGQVDLPNLLLARARAGSAVFPQSNR